MTNDFSVGAEANEFSQTTVGAEASKPAEDPGKGIEGAEGVVAVGIGLGIYNNTVHALVDAGATIDVGGAFKLESELDYPYLIDSPVDSINPADYLRDLGPEGWAFFNDGTLGLASNLFNSFITAEAEEAETSVGGAFGITVYNNESIASIGSGAQINQTADSRFRSGDQSVEVNADTAMHLIEMGGIGGLSLNIEGGAEAFEKFDESKFLDALTELVNPFGAEGEKSGIGGTLLLNITDNNTQATVEDGARIYTGAGLNLDEEERGLTVKASQDIFSFAFGEAGAAGESGFGVSGTALVGILGTTTVAQVSADAIVDAAALHVHADDNMVRIAVAGAVALGESAGIGLTVGVNEITRDTRAVIGATDPGAPSEPDLKRNFTIEEGVDVDATSEGALYVFAVAGAKASGSEEPPPTQLFFGNEAEQGVRQETQDGEADLSVGLAGALSINLVTDDVQASIADAGELEAGSVAVTSDNASDLVVATGGLAFAEAGDSGGTRSEGGTAAGLAGAVSYNQLTGTTRSFIQSTDLDLTASSGDVLLIEAQRSGDIISVAASGAGAHATGAELEGSSGKAITVAGSVSVNNVEDTTEALLIDSGAVLAGGDATISAVSDPLIVAIAGGLAFSLAKGGETTDATALAFGVALGVNEIDGDVRARLDDATIEIGGAGELTVTATSNATIVGITLGSAVSAAVGEEGGDSIAGTGAGSLSINTIDVRTEASIANDSNVTAGSVAVTAQDQSHITALAGGIAVAAGISGEGSAKTVAAGAAFSINWIGGGDGNHVWATIEDSDVRAHGDVTLTADENASIVNLAIGAAGSASVSTDGTAVAGSLAGSISANRIRSNNQARIKNSSVDADGEVRASSTDGAHIVADAGGFALALAASGDSNAISIGVGASIAVNDIGVDLLAAVDENSIVDASSLTLTASSDSTIEAQTLVGSAAVSVSEDGAEAYSGGAAFAVNLIADTTHAEVDDLQVELHSGAVTVTATDTSSIVSDTGSAALAVAASTTESLAISLGVGVSVNTISDDVAAEIDGSTITSMAGVDVEATFAADIFGFSYGLAGAIGGGVEDLGVGIAGAGSISVATIAGNTTAAITDSTVDAGGNVTVHATDSATIDTFSGAAALGVGASEDIGVGVAVGVSVATDDISGSTTAAIDGSTVENAGDVSVEAISTETVHAVTLGGAAAVGVGLETAGVAIAGAGAVSVNDVHTAVTARAEDSHIDATGAVVISASDASAITADAGGFALALGASGDALGIAVGVGASLAVNDIGIDVLAAVDDTEVNAGNLTVAASSDASIDALSFVGTAAVAIGSFSLGVAGGGAVAVNSISNTVGARISDGSQIDLSSGELSVTARDSSHIDANSGGAALALAISPGGIAAGISFGAALAVNTISNGISAEIDNSTVTSPAGVSVEATSTAGISAFAFGLAGAVAAGAGPGSIALGGAGSGSIDTIADSVTAHIDDSTVDAGGNLTVSAIDNASIDASSAGVAVAVAVSLDLAGAGAVGLSIAINDINDSTIASIDGSTVHDAGSVNVTANSTATVGGVTIAGAAAAGVGINAAGVAIAGAGAISINNIHDDIEALVQNSTISHTGAIEISATDASAITADAGGFALAIAASVEGLAIAFGIGASIAINDIGDTVLAGVENSQLLDVGGLSVTATSTSSIDALSIIASGAVAISGTGAGAIAGAAAMSVNTINNTTHAEVDGSQVTLDAGSVTVEASDASSIDADSGSAAIAVAVGVAAVGLSVALGAGLSVNNVGNDVEATIDGSTVSSTGGVSVEATSTTSITAFSFGIAGAVAGGAGGGGALAGAGSGSGAFIGNTTKALISDSTVDAGGDVTVTATDSAAIETVAGSVAAAVGVGGVLAVSVAIGLSVSVNDITDHTSALIENSTFADAGDVTVAADSTATIDAITVVGAVAVGVGVGGIVGLAGAISGAGAISVNTIDNTLEAAAEHSDFALRSGADFSVIADDGSHLTASATSVSVAVAVGIGIVAGGIAVAVGASVAANDIGDITTALVDDVTAAPPAGQTMGQFEVAADSDASITSISVSAAGAVAVAAGIGAGISLSGAGAASVNAIGNTTQAEVENSHIGPARLVTVEASNNGDIEATAVGAAITVSAALAAGSLSFGLSLTDNEIHNVTLAEVENSSLTSVGAASVHAASTGHIDANSIGAAISIAGGGGAIAGAIVASIANNAITNSTQALVLDSAGPGQGLLAAGDISIDASDVTSIHAVDVAASVSVALGAIAGAISVAASPATNTIDNLVRANIDASNVASTGGNIDATATSNNDIEATSQAYSLAASLGASGAGAGSSANNLIGEGSDPATRQTTEASITGGSTVSASGTVTVEAHDVSNISALVLALAAAGGAGSAALGISLSDNQIGGTVAAHIDNSSVTSTQDNIVVSASAVQTVDVQSVGVAASNGLSASGAQADSKLTDTVEAYAHSATLTAFGKVTVEASSSHTGTASTDSVGAGALDFAIALPSVEIGGSTLAFVDGISTVVAPGGLDITAYSNAVASADAVPLAVGLINVGTTGAKTTVDRLTDAHLGAAFDDGNNTASSITAGNVSISASSDTSANATAHGGGGGGISINVYVVEADNSSDVRAYVGANAALSVDSLDVVANANSRTANTNSLIVSISVVDAAGTNSTANVGGVTEAFIGSNSTVASSGTVSILGESGKTNATAQATLGQGGILAGIGGTVSHADDTSSTTASVRDGAHIGAGELDIKTDFKGFGYRQRVRGGRWPHRGAGRRGGERRHADEQGLCRQRRADHDQWRCQHRGAGRVGRRPCRRVVRRRRPCGGRRR